MSIVCSKCRGVFYSTLEHKNHNCRALAEKPPQTQPPPKSTKGFSIAERLAAVLPIGELNSGGDDTPLVHESQSQFQNAMLHLAKNSTAEHSVKIFPHDVRAILRGVHLLCDRIEEGGGARP